MSKASWVGFAALIVMVGLFGLVMVLGRTLPPPPASAASPSEEEKQAKRNEWVIREVRRCEDAGLRAERIYNGWTYETTNINCVPRDE